MTTPKIRIRLKAYDHKLLDQSAGEIVDTAHLRGIIDRLQDLGYTILEMRCLPD